MHAIGLFQPNGQLSGGSRRNAGMVDQDLAVACNSGNPAGTENDGLHRPGFSDTGEDDIGKGRHTGRVGFQQRTGGNHRLALIDRAVPHRHLVPGFQQPKRHGLAHQSDTNEAQHGFCFVHIKFLPAIAHCRRG